MDTCANQSAYRAELQKRCAHENYGNMQVEPSKDNEKTDENYAAEGESNGEPDHDMLQEPACDRALVIFCTIEDHFEHYGPEVRSPKLNILRYPEIKKEPLTVLGLRLISAIFSLASVRQPNDWTEVTLPDAEPDDRSRLAHFRLLLFQVRTSV